MARFLVALASFLSLHGFAALKPLDLVYSAQGHNNTSTSFDLIALVGDIKIATAKQLYAIVQYSDLSKSAEINQIPIQRIAVGTMPVVKLPYIRVKVDRLKPTTMYRAAISVYSLENGSYTALFTSPFYYTTTTGSDPKSLVRTRMILKGLKEFSDSEKGFVGQNGTVAVDGTRYGADPGEKWCSEFYAWVAAPSLKGIAGASSVKKITKYFENHNGMMAQAQIATQARRGDYLSMDPDSSGAANHSGMFLAFDRDDEGDFVWTLEGNSGNQIKVHRRPYDRFFKGLGHIMSSQI